MTRAWIIKFLSSSLLFAFVVAILVFFLLFLPLKVILFLLPSSWLPEAASTDDSSITNRLTFFSVFLEVFFYLPWLYLTTLRWFFWTSADREFFRALELRAPDDLSKSFSSMPVLSIWSTIYNSLGHWTYLVLLGMLLKFLSLMPFIGGFVLPLAHFYWISRVLGYPNAIGIAVLSAVLPGADGWTGALVNLCFGAWGIAKELLSSYYLRLPRAVVKLSLKKNRALVLGLGVPAVFLLAMPIVGPLFWLPLIRAGAFVSILLESEDRNLALI